MGFYYSFVAALWAVQVNALFRWMATEQYKDIHELAEIQSNAAIN